MVNHTRAGLVLQQFRHIGKDGRDVRRPSLPSPKDHLAKTVHSIVPHIILAILYHLDKKRKQMLKEGLKDPLERLQAVCDSTNCKTPLSHTTMLFGFLEEHGKQSSEIWQG